MNRKQILKLASEDVNFRQKMIRKFSSKYLNQILRMSIEPELKKVLVQILKKLLFVEKEVSSLRKEFEDYEQEHHEWEKY